MARLLGILLIAFLAFAQPYRCEWQVVAIADGDVCGGYRVGSTGGQTAIGWMRGANILAHIGFWYPEITTGIEERGRLGWENAGVKETRLFPAAPNPFSRTTQVRYTLNAEHRTLIQVCDITGRVVRTLVNSNQKPGRYAVNWDGKDNTGRMVASGVYICRFTAGDYRHNTKLILQR